MGMPTATLPSSHLPPVLPCPKGEEPKVLNEDNEDKKQLVMLNYHDESIYNTNKGQCWKCGEDDHPALLTKVKG